MSTQAYVRIYGHAHILVKINSITYLRLKVWTLSKSYRPYVCMLALDTLPI